MTALGAACLAAHSATAAVALAVLGIVCGCCITLLPTAAAIRRLPPGFVRFLRVPVDAGIDQPPSLRNAFAINAALVGLNLIASLSVLLAAGSSIPPGQHLNVLAVFYLGFAASFLAIPVPAGVGVREAAIVALGLVLAPQVGSPVLISVALLARCWQLSIDILSLGLGASLTALKRFRQG
jgi:uncharacterized membrane protein YbhN (UPF0104 family)